MQRGRHVYKKEKLSLVATPLYISKIKQTEDFNFAALANNWKKKKKENEKVKQHSLEQRLPKLLNHRLAKHLRLRLLFCFIV